MVEIGRRLHLLDSAAGDDRHLALAVADAERSPSVRTVPRQDAAVLQGDAVGDVVGVDRRSSARGCRGGPTRSRGGPGSTGRARSSRPGRRRRGTWRSGPPSPKKTSRPRRQLPPAQLGRSRRTTRLRVATAADRPRAGATRAATSARGRESSLVCHDDARASDAGPVVRSTVDGASSIGLRLPGQPRPDGRPDSPRSAPLDPGSGCSDLDRPRGTTRQRDALLGGPARRRPASRAGPPAGACRDRSSGASRGSASRAAPAAAQSRSWLGAAGRESRAQRPGRGAAASPTRLCAPSAVRQAASTPGQVVGQVDRRVLRQPADPFRVSTPAQAGQRERHSETASACGVDGQHQRPPVGRHARPARTARSNRGARQLGGDHGVAGPERLEAVARRHVPAVGELDPVGQLAQVLGIERPVEGDAHLARRRRPRPATGCGWLVAGVADLVERPLPLGPAAPVRAAAVRRDDQVARRARRRRRPSACSAEPAADVLAT